MNDIINERSDYELQFDCQLRLIGENLAIGSLTQVDDGSVFAPISKEQAFAFFEGLPIDQFKRLIMQLQAKRDPARMAELLCKMTWGEFEQAVAEAYQGQGWTAELTKSGADGGVDVFLRKGDTTWLVQCKHWQSKVNVKEVREIYGLMHHHNADRVVIVSLMGFTARATEFVHGKAVDLVDGKQLASKLSVLPDEPSSIANRPMVANKLDALDVNHGVSYINAAGWMPAVNATQFCTRESVFNNYCVWARDIGRPDLTEIKLNDWSNKVFRPAMEEVYGDAWDNREHKTFSFTAGGRVRSVSYAIRSQPSLSRSRPKAKTGEEE
ncbi:restriction endonuclease [Novilysobacter arseniciresistens]|uniref:restriction endonuclease n=1 Tax=Novilysobacter arseniciresistens TaxID=1385522 RepID=UPI0009DCC22C|nr:restriction endonuclease [Lysobacter arseniciresistens]